jgi:hypothetical protein
MRCDNIPSLSHPILAAGRGDTVLENLIIAVMAGIAVHYICKWLDGDESDF